MYEEGFQQAWRTFLTRETVPIYNPLRTHFSHGRHVDIALAIRLYPEQIPAGVRQIASRLKGLSSVLLFPEDYYHISVKLLGFLNEERRHADDLSEADLKRIRKQTASLLKRATPFSVHLRLLNVLGCYVVLEADDGGYIPRLQAAFHEETRDIPEYQLEGAEWLPHLSLGAFRISRLPPEEKARLVSLRRLQGGIVHVDRLDLVRAELRKPFPRLCTLESYPL